MWKKLLGVVAVVALLVGVVGVARAIDGPYFYPSPIIDCGQISLLRHGVGVIWTGDNGYCTEDGTAMTEGHWYEDYSHSSTAYYACDDNQWMCNQQ